MLGSSVGLEGKLVLQSAGMMLAAPAAKITRCALTRDTRSNLGAFPKAATQPCAWRSRLGTKRLPPDSRLHISSSAFTFPYERSPCVVAACLLSCQGSLAKAS